MKLTQTAGALGVGLVLLLCLGCGDTPQLGSDACLGAADALWTSVTAKSVDLLDQSAAKIDKLHASADLSDAAFEQLSAVIATARAGDWAGARAALKKFVRGQRPIKPRS